jgi:hypothetical protein
MFVIVDAHITRVMCIVSIISLSIKFHMPCFSVFFLNIAAIYNQDNIHSPLFFDFTFHKDTVLSEHYLKCTVLNLWDMTS